MKFIFIDFYFLNQFFQVLLDYGGQKFRQANLFNTQTSMGITRQLSRGLKVRNLFNSHHTTLHIAGN